jgi:hypothetical protein
VTSFNLGNSGHLTELGKILMLLSAIYHWVMGPLSMMSVKWTRKIGGSLYSLKLPEELDPRYEYTWKPLGASAVFIAGMATFAYLHPTEVFSVVVLDLLALLYLLRALMRLIYRDLFFRAYGVPFKRNLGNIIFNVLIAGIIYFYGSA